MADSAQRYFISRFGKSSQVAWAADSFGHSAGLPSIFSQAGIRYYAFFRPSESLFHLESPAFWWKGSDGSRILAYRPPMGWYGIERNEVAKRLDENRVEAEKHSHRNVAIFYGLGNHGGGPSRRHLKDIRAWIEKNPDVQVVHSGLHRFFAALEEEVSEKSRLQEVTGELNFFARGCYSAAAKFKFRYRKAEAGLVRAEATTTALSAGLGLKAPDLQEAWRGLLFNSFHDILPGSSIERATQEQISWVEGLIHSSQALEFHALNALAFRINAPAKPSTADHPQPVTMLVWNPHPHDYHAPLELEAHLDYRPIWKYNKSPEKVPVEVRDARGRLVPFQSIATESHFMRQLPWRKRVVIDAKIPAMGWATYTLGWVEGAKNPAVIKPSASAKSNHVISGANFTVSAKKEASGIQIHSGKQSLFSRAGFSLQTLDDPWGPWGNHYEEAAAEDISTLLETWKVTEVEVLESGPLRSSLWVRFQDSASRAEFTFHVHHDRPVIEVQARVFWNRPAARLKMVMPGVGKEAEYEILGGSIQRGSLKEVPGGRWVRVFGSKRSLGFASDALYNYDLKGDTLRATIVRSSRYASDVPETTETPKHFPVIDSGEYRFNFLFTTAVASLPQLARELEAPPITLPIPAQTGTLGRFGTFLKVKNPNLQLLALKPAENGKGWIVRLQELGIKKTKPVLEWLGTSLTLEELSRSSMGTYRLFTKFNRWHSVKVLLDEETISHHVSPHS